MTAVSRPNRTGSTAGASPRRWLAGAAPVVLCAFLSLPTALAAPAIAAPPVGAVAASRDSIQAAAREIRDLIARIEWARADSLSRLLLERVESRPTSDSLRIADALDVRVECLIALAQKPDSAWFDLAQRAVAIRERFGGPDDAALAVSLRNLAPSWRWRYGAKSAIPLCERALAIEEKTLGPDDVEVAVTLHVLANLVHETRDFQRAKALRDRQLAIREQALGPNDLTVARTLVSRGNLLRDMGEYAASRRDLERALAIFERGPNPNHPGLAVCCNNLANDLAETGDLAGALPLRERALAVWSTVYGPESQSAASALNNLANLLADMGENERAIPLYEKSIRIYRAWGGPEVPGLIVPMLGLAEVLDEEGEQARAIDLLETDVRILERSFGPQERGVALCLDALANVHRRRGDDSTARAQYERALSIWEINGPKTLEASAGQNDMANLLRDHGERAAAESLYQRALDTRVATLGPDHPDVGATLGDLAVLRLSQGREREAAREALGAEGIRRAYLRLAARGLPERQALGVLRRRPSGLDAALSAIGRSGSAMIPQAFDAIVRSRALVLDEIALRHQASWSDGDTTAMRLAASLAQVRQRLANLTLNGSPDDPIRYRSLIESARAEEDKDERALAHRSARFEREHSRMGLGGAEVTAALPPGSAIVSYWRYKRYPRATRVAARGPQAPAPGQRPQPPVTSYVAVVVRAGGSPAVVQLGAASVIDSLVARWTESVAHGPPPRLDSSDDPEARATATGRALERAVWDPIAPLLSDRRLVFLVPDGALNQVSFAALPAGNGRYLLESRQALHYLAAERDIVPASVAPRRNSGLLAFGGVAFDDAAAEPASGRAALMGAGGSGRAAGPVFRGALPACDGFRALRFRPLPGTLRESREIVELWGAAHRTASATAGAAGSAPALWLTGAQASEAAFKRLAPLSGVLHLATHGFFLDAGCSSPADSLRGIGGMFSAATSRPAGAGDDPLLLSGLALAGANRRAEAAADQEDGILTADEIAAADLSAVRWAVLSACHTGEGRVQPGEGVLGLRRAFQIAGVGSTIVSLWAVEDESTREWMHALYRARLERHASTAESVRAACIEVLEARRARHQSTHPFFWGAFVAAGDWR